MERTRPPGGLQTNAESIPIQGDPVSRVTTMGRLGLQYQGQRDMYQALGYDYELTLRHYIQAYERQDIARKINNAPVVATWRGPVKVTDSSEQGDQRSAFDEAWDDLAKRLRLWNKFARLDRLVGLGQYAVLVLGFDDVRDDNEFREPVAAGNRRLLYIHPYHQINAQIEEYDNDPQSERYGLPLTYKVYSATPGQQNEITDIIVHYQRVIHVAENLLESELFGHPRLKAVWNRLQDLMKIVGGSAEMFWRGARPGYAAKLDREADLGQQDKEELQNQLSEYEHDLRRWLRLQGMDIEQLSPQVADPSNHVDVELSMVAAATGIPKRMLIGSERGELSSQLDETNWNQLVQDRRENFAEQAILRPFIDRLVEFGTLPTPTEEDYDVQWPDLWTPGLKDQAEIATKISSAVKEYTSAPGADTVVPVKVFLGRVLGWPDEVVDQVVSEIQGMAGEEEREAAEEGENALEETEGENEGEQET